MAVQRTIISPERQLDLAADSARGADQVFDPFSALPQVRSGLQVRNALFT
jgi:hypothetical protein